MGGDDDQSDHEDRDDHQSEHSDQDQVDNEGGQKIKTKQSYLDSLFINKY